MTSSDRLRLLVVDDQEAVADGWAELLQIQGFDARAVYGGVQAIELISTFEPQCVLFDIAMPGMDGLQLARHMRSVHRDDVVLLAMTGDVDDARAADTFAVVDHYFAKPFDLVELMKILGPMR